jgi:hypothetical protein
MRLLKFIVSVFFSTIIVCSCKKDSFIISSQAQLGLSADSLTFDTVFTSVGSITKSFKIFNLNNQKLKLSKVKLAGGASSSFKINVDGTAATEVDNIDIAANDSLYVFVQVNIDPHAGTLPFIITDSILINYNGNDQLVKLQAYGQNAVFLNSRRVSGSVTFTKDLPYVILGGLLVDSTATLTIQPGSKIYLHADAPIIVDGTLIASGTKQDNIVFNGDRLDPDYRDLPASWPGIYFRENSQNNTLQFTAIKNAYQGLISLGLSTTVKPKLKISQCVLDNIYDAGILGINTSINADNSLISNCGSNILLAYGGDYVFTHCTAASYGNIFTEHKDPVLQVYDFIKQDNQVLSANTKAVFTNCIFWGDGGNVDDEVVAKKQGTANTFQVTFDHVLYKAKDDPANVTFNASIKNQDPLFDTIDLNKSQFDFHFNNHSDSPAIDAGIATPLPKDLDDRPRINGALPDIGCYEK